MFHALIIAALVLTPASPVSPQSPPAPNQQAIKAVTWNVWNGFNHHKQIDAGIEWLQSQQPDVVAFQELVGIDADRLATIAARYGHEHSVICKEGGYPVGLTSNRPIEVIERHTEGMHHGYLHARCNDIDWFVVHLHPGDWAFRLKEAHTLAKAIKPVLASKRRVCVLGDFNAHSQVDSERLAAQTQLRDRRDDGSNLRDGTFDHEVMQTFLDLGLVDLCQWQLETDPHFKGTFPTRVLQHAAEPEAQQQWLERIDFILLDPATAATCLAVAMPRGGPLDIVSDHYPVIMMLPNSKTRDTTPAP
ncbi:MAG TPA: endonuclease/exonuclease/phosphatase family protein [Phycisphaerales bacterium]|jgi:exonuclease III|nr:endonuclease/exonuclease/phosphatase family protein [Phycisphaerales bacterium]